MSILGKNRHIYVSELDKFIEQFESQRTVTPPSREKEVQKHQKIADKRDKKR